MINIVKGSDPRLVVTLQQKDNCGIMPLNITSGMVVSCVYKDLQGVKTKTGATVEVTDPVYGKLLIHFTDAETEKMKLGNLDFDIYVDEGSERLIWRFIGKVQVQDRVR